MKQIHIHAPKVVTKIARKILPRALRRRFGLSHSGPELTLREARAELAPLGLSLRKIDGRYRVSRRGVTGVAYESDDLRDAVESARRLAVQEPEEKLDEDGDALEELEGDELA